LEGEEGEGDVEYDEAYYHHQQQHAHGQHLPPPLPTGPGTVTGARGGGVGKRGQ
jgi:hypothetical protein